MISTYDAVGIAEGFIEVETLDEVIEAWQQLIDTGVCWTLQGYFGRQAQALIEAGVCRPAPQQQEH